MSLEEILKKYWGYDQFRPLQKDIIQSVLDSKDTLALLPTGGGKSICFQVPALAKEGICIVVSPLIALMKDQVQNLRKRHIAAECIFSGMHYRDIDRILDNCIFGNIKFLYLSPERLQTPLLQARIAQMKVNLIAIDEAHCISQWGYNFRPAYLEIVALRELFPKVPFLALTATATPQVVQDIQEKLAFKSPHVIKKSFHRANLVYVAIEEHGKEKKMLEILRKVRGSAIVYTRSRKHTKAVSDYLNARQISASFYHAGLSHDQRNERQEDWINNKKRVMVATNAFGMGIDKPDVRNVIHLDLPNSLEAYFQEAGRAGRDEKKAFAVLLYNSSDLERLSKYHDIAFPEFKLIKQVYKALGSYLQLAVGAGKGSTFDFDLPSFCQTYDLKPLTTFHSLKILQDAGWIHISESIYVPSKMKILVSREGLYSYQVENKGNDLLLKTILRTYQGAFSHPINIYEKQLARFLKTNTEKIIHALKKMQIDGILEFFPQKDIPQITFLQERVPAENLTIDQELFKFLKERDAEQIKKVITYTKDSKCRSNFLQLYFGEKDTKPCGICDLCLLNKTSSQNLEETILKKLENKAWKLEDLINDFSSIERDKVIEILSYLLENKKIKKAVDDQISIS